MIERLSSETIGKIAAGEVIERPSSVVKELLENALDAGPSRIAVEVEGGGVQRIRVVDDGCGIPLDDLPLALERHATSKLAGGDLTNIATLGFRGEALASIAAVAEVRLVSRWRGSEHGGEILGSFGNVGPAGRVAAPVGTSVTVADLFANVPARRKFLKQPATEVGAIQRVVAAYAVARPEVAFSLTVDGRRLFATDGSGDLQAAATGVLGPDIGRDLIPLPPLEEHARVPGVSVSGWVCAPSQHRAHRQQMLVFVNGRLVQHRALTYVVEEAYHTLLMVGRHPITLHRVEIEPQLVDVNVHPTKAEVRFVDERAVCRAVQRTTHAALASAPEQTIPEIGFSAPEPVRTMPTFQPSLTTAPLGATTVVVDEAPEPARKPAAAVPMLRVLGQVAASYIIAEGPDGLYLIDQHAAHERVLYEALQRQLQERAVERQPYLDPLIVELDPTENAVLERSLEELRAIGFEIESFGEGAWAVRAVPTAMAQVDLRERLRLILAELAEGGVGNSWLDSVAISAACHTSIRAGQVLSLTEMRELVQQLEQTQHPRACGHGRPTMLRMSQGELEKQFNRR